MTDTDDREALAKLIHSLMVLQKVNTADDVAREILSAGFHRQGPPTDAQVVYDAIVAEQKRIAALPDNHKPWTGDEGRAWQNGMANAARIARAALEAATVPDGWKRIDLDTGLSMWVHEDSYAQGWQDGMEEASA